MKKNADGQEWIWPNALILLLVCLLLSAISTPLQAEVMDKEPSVSDNWISVGILSLVAILAWPRRWWAGVIVSAFFLFTRWGVWAELREPFVGPAIFREAGAGYVKQFYLSAGLGLAVHLVAAVYGIWKVRRSRLLP